VMFGKEIVKERCPGSADVKVSGWARRYASND
jgi:hypothetical protein